MSNRPRKSTPNTPNTPNTPDVSVLLPFRDDEDIVGTACLRLAEHLRNLDLTFELLAIEEDSGDNSHVLLGLLRAKLPELRVLYANNRERGFATGAREARGRSLLLIDANWAQKPLAALARATRRILDGEVDAVFAPERFAVCHRVRTFSAVSSTRGRRLASLRRRIAGGGGRVEVLGRRARRWLRPRDTGDQGGSRPFDKLITAFMLPRF